jgi:pimeloyl-ACP methyl ester carboxylesterase
VQEWTRTGFQGGLNWYRTATDPAKKRDLDLFAGKKIEVPATFISGESDWGNYQEPGALEGLETTCKRFLGCRFIKGAGHWPQQEQHEAVTAEILKFLDEVKGLEKGA